jgi:peptidoglycan hydrolase CwlO-like protein
MAAALAAGVVLGVGTGWAVGQASAVPTAPAPQPWAETTQALRQSQEDVVRLTGDVKALKVAVETLKDGLDRGRADDAARQAQLVDRLGRAAQEGAAQSASLNERLDRIEALAKDPAARIASLGERMERIETEVSAAVKAAAAPAQAVTPAALSAAAPAQPPAPVPAAAAETPTQTGSVPKDAAVEGWVLHEVYDGVALIEGRNRRLVEVGPGEMVPGIGRVEAIERRGKRWVVITPKGVISMVR